ncbi:hypothetical protein [Mycetocola zhadangensis]|uniref:hypothetical protein n=1 Tax=Mycetocola zhadangensis TaxID=1164595 RepID=UPI0011C4A155|nr:hypothetical protein [Mycetocola zhadangensis]GGE93228.1 hypothetical protein GCM10011313_15320 [Mycetocola zhadangensis]
MTTSAAHSPTPHPTGRAPETPLNPLRYHAMVNPIRIPEPTPPRRPRRRWPAIAGLGFTAVLLAVAVAVSPTLAALLPT